MKCTGVIGLIALLPAALGVSAPAAGSILMPLCTGDGQVHMVPVPGSGAPGGARDNGCCIKGCHAGSSRKRIVREFEPAQ